MSDFHQNFIKIAIEIYGLELDGHQIDTILETWLKQYDPTWILKAIVESLYRGRYKIVSVENILKDWKRLGHPRYQFTPEYEREILEKIPHPAPRQIEAVPKVGSTEEIDTVAIADAPVLSSTPTESSESTAQQLACPLPLLPVPIDSEHLNPEEAAPFQSHHHSLSISHHTVQVDVNRDSKVEPTQDPSFDDNSRSDNGTVARLSPPINLLQRRGRSPIQERIRTQPVSCKLFNTLKAIVDPNSQNSATVRDAYIFPPLGVGNSQMNKIASFTLPIDSPNEERV